MASSGGTEISVGPINVLALGDSYTVGEQVGKLESWPVQLVRSMRVAGRAVSEPTILAVSGWSTSDLIRGVQLTDLQTPFDVVTLQIGVNNQFRQGTIVDFEADIAELEDAEERAMFLSDMGLDQPGVAKLIAAAYRLLKLQTYFTAGVKEVRAWTIHKGYTAPEAAGVIHTDFQKGFIRAEVMKLADFLSLGSEQAVKEAGKLSVEGKEYIVQDGDIMHFRFNV